MASERKIVVWPLKDVADENADTGLFAIYYEPFDSKTDKVVYVTRGQLQKEADNG